MNNSISIKRNWIRKAEEPIKKYNPSFIKAVEEWTGEVAADYREASDVGIDPQHYQFNESIA